MTRSQERTEARYTVETLYGLRVTVLRDLARGTNRVARLARAELIRRGAKVPGRPAKKKPARGPEGPHFLAVLRGFYG